MLTQFSRTELLLGKESSLAFVPSVAGLIIAGEVVKDLTGVRGQI